MRRRLLPPAFAALDLGTAGWTAQALSAFCELELPQALAGRSCTAAELSAAGHGNEALLFRLLRNLCAYDVVRYAGDGRFALSHVGKGLIGRQSAASMIRYANASWHAAAYASLAQGIRRNASGFAAAHGQALFERLRENSAAGALFDAGMQAMSRLYAPPFAAAYDFSHCTSVVDVGGGTGVLLQAIVERYPNVRATVFELPACAQRARAVLDASAFAACIDVVEGDILRDAPPPARAYVLSHVLHDWDDETCAKMLANVRRSMAVESRLLVYELIAPSTNNAWSQDRLTDLEMMAMLPGRERTRKEFDALLQRSGLRVRRVLPTAAAECIVEAMRDDAR